MGRQRDDADGELATEQFAIDAEELDGGRTKIAMSRPDLEPDLKSPKISRKSRSSAKVIESRSKPGSRRSPPRGRKGEGRRGSGAVKVRPSRQLASHGDRETWLGTRGDEMVFIERSRAAGFGDEASAAARLSHPNIAEPLDLVWTGASSITARDDGRFLRTAAENCFHALPVGNKCIRIITLVIHVRGYAARRCVSVSSGPTHMIRHA